MHLSYKAKLPLSDLLLDKVWLGEFVEPARALRMLDTFTKPLNFPSNCVLQGFFLTPLSLIDEDSHKQGPPLGICATKMRTRNPACGKCTRTTTQLTKQLIDEHSSRCQFVEAAVPVLPYQSLQLFNCRNNVLHIHPTIHQTSDIAHPTRASNSQGTQLHPYR